MSQRPVALTCGEPAGIGPEIAVKAWHALDGAVPFFWIGDPRHLPEDTPWVEIATPAEALKIATGDGLPVLRHAFAAPQTPGTPVAANAPGVIEAIERGVDLVRAGEAAALCTAPIHKQALQDGAGFAFPGHTEFLAHLAGGCDVVMMLASPLLRVVPATIHIPVADVPRALSPKLLRAVISLTHQGLQDRFGIAAPRIAVAGLNPHAGENGKIGTEEVDWITDLVDRMRAEGFDLRGPLAADTLFHAAARQGYDVAICMYHDQALIPIKTLDFDGGVNVTLGLPFLRTSPDHGTAFDIAGQNIANPASLMAALKMAADAA